MKAWKMRRHVKYGVNISAGEVKHFLTSMSYRGLRPHRHVGLIISVGCISDENDHRHAHTRVIIPGKKTEKGRNIHKPPKANV